jgi:ADP-ribose pyrophosphatase
VSVEILAQGRFLTLKKEGRWEYVSRVHASGAVHILALTAKRELILVEQERVPVHARTIELPAGIVGDEVAFRGEAVEACAMRELLEETGYRGREAKVIFTGPTAPGMTSEMVSLVQVFDPEKIADGGGVDGENITVHLVPLSSVEAFLDQQRRQGLLIDPRIPAALYFTSL